MGGERFRNAAARGERSVSVFLRAIDDELDALHSLQRVDERLLDPLGIAGVALELHEEAVQAKVGTRSVSRHVSALESLLDVDEFMSRDAPREVPELFKRAAQISSHRAHGDDVAVLEVEPLYAVEVLVREVPPAGDGDAVVDDHRLVVHSRVDSLEVRHHSAQCAKKAGGESLGVRVVETDFESLVEAREECSATRDLAP